MERCSLPIAQTFVQTCRQEARVMMKDMAMEAFRNQHSFYLELSMFMVSRIACVICCSAPSSGPWTTWRRRRWPSSGRRRPLRLATAGCRRSGWCMVRRGPQQNLRAKIHVCVSFSLRIPGCAAARKADAGLPAGFGVEGRHHGGFTSQGT